MIHSVDTYKLSVLKRDIHERYFSGEYAVLIICSDLESAKQIQSQIPTVHHE